MIYMTMDMISHCKYRNVCTRFFCMFYKRIFFIVRARPDSIARTCIFYTFVDAIVLYTIHINVSLICFVLSNNHRYL